MAKGKGSEGCLVFPLGICIICVAIYQYWKVAALILLGLGALYFGISGLIKWHKNNQIVKKAMVQFDLENYPETLNILGDLDNKTAMMLKKECYYEIGVQYYKNEQYKYAVAQLEPIKDYKDAEFLIQESVKYLHDKSVNDLTERFNVAEFASSSWFVLESKENKSLLLKCECCGECTFSNSDSGAYVTWESSNVRTKMKDYYRNEFSPLQQTAIVKSESDPKRDYVFALSKAEVEKYVIKLQNALKNKGKPSFVGNKLWWTSTIAPDFKGFSCVYVAGLNGINFNRATETCGIRPAMWIDLSSDYFWHLADSSQ